MNGLHGLFSSKSLFKMKTTPFIRNIILASPLYLLVPIPFVLFADYLAISINYKEVLLGALGWWIALLVRMPVILLVRKKGLSTKLSNRITVGISGPAEEIVRIIILTIIGLNYSNAYSLGLGWASIEILYGLFQVIGLGILDQKTDAKAEEAKQMMKQMGMDKTLKPSVPYWGALERFSAGALHIGFSLLLLISPYMLILTIPLHSMVNFLVVKMNKVSIEKSQLLLFIIGGLVLLSGIVYS